MNWFHLKLYLIVAVIITPYFIAADGEQNFNLSDEDEMVPSEQTIDDNDVTTTQKVSRQSSFIPNLSRNIGHNSGFQLASGLNQAPFVGNPFDAQASSASNKVWLVLNNDKNNLADLAKPSEESLKRLTRNPDILEDVVGQFLQLGGDMTQQFDRSFGQAINSLVSKTRLLAQPAPVIEDVTELPQTLSQSNPPGLGLRQFLVGATQNLFNPAGAQDAPKTAAAQAETNPDAVVRAAAKAETKPEAPANPEAPKNAFEPIVGSPLLPLFSPWPKLPLCSWPLAAIAPLMQSGSEISEVRVMPDQYSPFKISPKPVDHQTLAEMKLKAVLRDALTKKTIPILWFHLPNNHHLHKSTEELEMKAKLEIFEKEVIAELKQLQELSKLANDVKSAQLQSGAQPTHSLTTKLNLYEIPIYEITLGDIEKTLKDEHVIILMNTLVQNQNKEFHRHHQATTKYLTDLTGNPSKRQTAEDALKTMEKDDMLKMMIYAYRMAAMNGHEMPWLKNEQMTGLNEKDASKTTMTSQQRQAADGNMPMTNERQWVEEKHRQMAEERNQFRQWADPNMQQSTQQQPTQQQPTENQWANPNMMQQQMPIHRQMLPPQMQQHMPIQRQMTPPLMQPSLPIQQQMLDPNMQRQPQDMQRQMMPQPMMSNFGMPPQMPTQRHMGLNPANMQQQHAMSQTQFADPNMQPMQREWSGTNMPETKGALKSDQQPEQRQTAETQLPEQQSTGDLRQIHQQPDHRQQIDTKTTEQTAAKMDLNMPRHNERLDNVPLVGEAKPQTADNADRERLKGIKDLFDELDVFDLGKHKGKEAAQTPPTIINYYYGTGGSRYPQAYAPAGGYQQAPAAPQRYGPIPQAHSYAPASYSAAPQHKPPASYYGGAAYGSNAYGSHGGYRFATGDDEIAVMLQQHQHQPMPKMMMKPNNEEPAPPTIPTSTTTIATQNYINNAEDPRIQHSKRLAKTKLTEIKQNPGPAAYILVMKNNTSKSDSRSRRKRSTEYATLESIDESSLDALRKKYKNSLKEITLNFNETPEEALMRYNAESIEENLQKANQQFTDISAGEEHEEVQGYAFSNNEKYMPVSTGPQIQLSNKHSLTLPVRLQQTPQPLSVVPTTIGATLRNDPSSARPGIVNSATAVPNEIFFHRKELSFTAEPLQQQQPLSVAYNQQKSFYDPNPNEEDFYDDFIPKYNTFAVYNGNNKMINQNPVLSKYNSLESVPHKYDYNVPNQQYQEANHDIINSPGKAYKSIVHENSYIQPYNHLNTPATKASNIINKNMQEIYASGQHITDYGKAIFGQYGNYASELPPTITYSTFSNNIPNNAHISSYSSAGEPHIELTNHHKHESSSFGNLMAIIKKRLDQCCNKCKDNILKDLDEPLKAKYYASGDKLKILDIYDKPHATTTEKPHIFNYSKPSSEEDKQWLADMSDKDYNKTCPTKPHQRNCLKDGQLHFHMTDKKIHSPEEKDIFHNNNQYLKRGTNTHNVFALRGKWHKPMPLDNNTNMNKLGHTTNSITNSNDKTNSRDKNENLEEILDIDLSKHTNEKIMESNEEVSSKVYPTLDNLTKADQEKYNKDKIKESNEEVSSKVYPTLDNLTKADQEKYNKDKIKESNEELSSKVYPTLDNSTKTTSSTTPTTSSSTAKLLTTPSTVTFNGISNVLTTERTNPVEKPQKQRRKRGRLSSKNRKLIKSSAESSSLKQETIK